MSADHLHNPATYAKSRATFRARLDARFWFMTDRSGSCWVWTGPRQTRGRYGGGYGTLKRFGRRLYAHRYAYELAVGPIPPRMEVLHSCDNPPCINPAHLRVGTHAENMAEAAARNRCPGNGRGKWRRAA